MKPRRVWIGLIAGFSLGFVAIATLFLARQFPPGDSPEEVAERFFVETYTHDFSSAWDLVSTSDQAARPREQYLAEHPALTPAQSALYEQLAAWGEFQVLALVSSQPDRAVVTARISYPNNAQPEFERLTREANADDADDSALLSALEALHADDQLQFVEGEISFDLLREGNQWRIVQGWGAVVTIQLSAVVHGDLPWDFYPQASEIQAVPGELVKATYIARNRSERTITAKAIHEVGPPESLIYFQTIECFCFTEQTLAAGEEREMSLLFRIDLRIPAGLSEIRNRYTFYSLADFPAEG